MITTKRKSRILEEVQETANDLAKLGFIDERRMKAHGLLTIPPVQPFSDARIRALRKRINVCQAALAALLNSPTDCITTLRQALDERCVLRSSPFESVEFPDSNTVGTTAFVVVTIGKKTSG